MAIEKKGAIVNRFSKIGRPFGPTGFLPPCEIFVSDELLERIQVFDEKGVYKRKWSQVGIRGINIYTPLSEVLGCTQYLFVRKWDYQGNYKWGWGMAYGHGLYGYNNISYECDYNDNWIQKHNISDGTGQGYWDTNSPDDICIYGNEAYVTCKGINQVRVYTLAGVPQRSWGSFGTGDGQFSYPQGIRVYKDEVFVCDYSNKRVQVFDTQGNFKRKWSTENNFNSYCDIYKDTILVGTCDIGIIYVYDLNGSLKGVIGSKGTDNGQFQMVSWISIRPM